MSKRIVSKRMVIMLIVLVIIFGAIFGWTAFMARMINNYFDHMPTPAASISTYDAQQDNWALTLEAVGHYGAPYFRGFGEGDNEHPIGPDYAHRAAPTYFNTRKTTIYGASNEIQRNIIAKMVLGL